MIWVDLVDDWENTNEMNEYQKMIFKYSNQWGIAGRISQPTNTEFRWNYAESQLGGFPPYKCPGGKMCSEPWMKWFVSWTSKPINSHDTCGLEANVARFPLWKLLHLSDFVQQSSEQWSGERLYSSTFGFLICPKTSKFENSFTLVLYGRTYSHLNVLYSEYPFGQFSPKMNFQ